MFISSNITGTSGSPLDKSSGRAGTNLKTLNPPDSFSEPDTFSPLNSRADRASAGSALELPDADSAGASVQSVTAGISREPATAMLAQANLTPESVLKLLQE